jgi:predicted amidohydrolase YtcJ
MAKYVVIMANVLTMDKTKHKVSAVVLWDGKVNSARNQHVKLVEMPRESLSNALVKRKVYA